MAGDGCWRRGGAEAKGREGGGVPGGRAGRGDRDSCFLGSFLGVFFSLWGGRSGPGELSGSWVKGANGLGEAERGEPLGEGSKLAWGQLLQSQLTLDLPRASYSSKLIFRHFRWTQVWQLSHSIASWFMRQGPRQKPHGNLYLYTRFGGIVDSWCFGFGLRLLLRTETGPGFTSMSPARRRRAAR